MKKINWEETGLLDGLDENIKIGIINLFSKAAEHHGVPDSYTTFIFPIIRRVVSSLSGDIEAIKNIDIIKLTQLLEKIENSDWYTDVVNFSYFAIDAEAELCVKVAQEYIKTIQQ